MSTVVGPRRGKHRPPTASEILRDRARRATESMTTNLQGGSIRYRLFGTFFVVVSLLGVMFVRVAWLQTIGSSGYREASIAQRTRISVIDAERGSILDRNGRELALPVPTKTVFADPEFVTDPVGAARSIALALALTPEQEVELAAKLQDKTSKYVPIARQATLEISDALMALKLDGVFSKAEASRALSSDYLRAVIGRTDPDLNGTAGLELQYNDLLAGVDGKSIREVNSKGKSIANTDINSIPAVAGSNLITTLDRNIQFQVDGLLAQQIERLSALSGTAIVMDTATGDILALSTIRRNENGTYTADSGNFAAVEAYEPGSVAKVFSIAAALDQKSVEPTSVFKVTPTLTFNPESTKWRYTIKDAYPHGIEDMTVRKILVDSSNIGTVQVAQTMAPETIYNYLTSFGFGSSSGVGFPGEAKGLLTSYKKWRGSENYTVSYGYGFAATQLQLVAAVNAVANNGVYVAPRLVSASVSPDGVQTNFELGQTRQVLKPETSAMMRSLMSDVVCFGTAKLAQVPGMTVAGKTGTAYRTQASGGYETATGGREYRASFVGFLPAYEPRFTVLVSVEDPDPSSRDRFGGTAAAPVFANIAQALITEYDVRPAATDLGCPKHRPAELGPEH
ncbi:MAG: penicillin-binding protein 2 [Actinobacteria bacterium]|nr:penicillin-binding protein 2 [Actinomycetota bacterium]